VERVESEWSEWSEWSDGSVFPTKGGWRERVRKGVKATGGAWQQETTGNDDIRKGGERKLWGTKRHEFESMETS
jgi:hypothetical protein